jgi:hypothetical protein
MAKTVTVTLVNRLGSARAGLTGLKWAFWDYATPALIASNAASPAAGGSAETTDGSGVFVADVAASALTNGQIGWLTVTNSDGTSTQRSAFAGPVAVAVF